MRLLRQITQPADSLYRYIPLTQGQVAIVDAEDYEELAKLNWQAHWDPHAKTFYAVRQVWSGNGKWRTVFMHRVIMKAPKGEQIDHIDGNGLHDWRENLRIATFTENRWNVKANIRNTSGFKGVTLDKRYGKWNAAIRANGKRYYLGMFGTAEAAHAAYVAAAKEKHGEFANW